MTALPEPPGHLLTVAEYAALGEGDRYRWELQEGSLVVSPSPTPRHMIASGELRDQIEPQLPPHLRVIQDVDIDLQFAPTDQPGVSRRPDLIIIDRTAVDRVDTEGGLLRACEVCLAVEIVSVGSRRMDHVIKRAEYADTGIPHYWIVDLDPPVTLLACHLAGEFGYQNAGAVTSEFTTGEPYALKINLGQLG